MSIFQDEFFQAVGLSMNQLQAANNKQILNQCLIFKDKILDSNEISINWPEIKFIYAESLEQFIIEDMLLIEQIYLPQVTKIGQYCFEFSLIKYLFLQQLESVEDYCFSGCKKLLVVNLPKATRICQCGFSECDLLYSITMPQVQTIENSAFYRCISLLNLSCPSLQLTEKNSFCECFSLQQIDLPSLVIVGSGAFYNCYSLHDIKLPLVEQVDKCGFFGCSSLQTLTFPQLHSVGQFAFKLCTSLTQVEFPLIQHIVENAFGGCFALQSLNIPQVENMKFMCSLLTILTQKLDNYNAQKLSFLHNNQLTDSDINQAQDCQIVNDCLILKEKYYYPEKFMLRSDFAAVYAPKLQIASFRLFFGCKARNFYFPLLSKVDAECFCHCQFNQADFPFLLLVMRNAFNNCAIQRLTLNQAEYVLEKAFFGSTLTQVALHRAQTIPDYAFSQCLNLRELQLPGAYKLGKMAFHGCVKLKTVSLSEVQSMYHSSFSGCILHSLELSRLSTVFHHQTADLNCTVKEFTVNGKIQLGYKLFSFETEKLFNFLKSVEAQIECDCMEGCPWCQGAVRKEFKVFHAKYAAQIGFQQQARLSLKLQQESRLMQLRKEKLNVQIEKIATTPSKIDQIIKGMKLEFE
uniref:Leucine rich repeats-containing protein n=1 Tax=Trepomonas sp. PC1 TaxID=1076344 RepID=A0A146KJ11_9EUKA|eukprot:JAP95249.1 Leucine rich repeats-containing protein [Trepomonas sp. PC1]